MVRARYLGGGIAWCINPACCIWIEIGFKQTLALVRVFSEGLGNMFKIQQPAVGGV